MKQLKDIKWNSVIHWDIRILYFIQWLLLKYLRYVNVIYETDWK